MSRLNLFGMTAKALTQGALALVSSGLLVACGGGDSVTTATRYTVGGSVTGLVGTGLVLEDNGGDSLTVAGNGSFKFATAVPNGAAYAVTVKTQPSNPAQSCVVTSGTGTINGADISGVAVKCTTNGYTVGGTVSGLSGSGLVLQDNGGNDLPISANGAFTFAQTVGSGSNYAVTVKTPPSNPAESCSVSNATGKVGNANVTNVVVNCSNQSFAVSGTIANLVGTGLTLRNNGAPLLFTGTTFSVALPSGSSYNITVASQPTGPSQTCVASNNTGTVTGGNITNVLVTCTTNTYHIKGTISGLTGSGFVLQDNGGNNLTVAANATAFQFTTAIASGQTYSVTVQTQPNAPAQYCVVTNGSGTVAAGDVTNVAVGCRNQGTYAFIADSANSTVSAFTITSNSGLLVYAGNAVTATPAYPTGVAAVKLSTGTYVYTSDFSTADVAKFSFDAGTIVLSYVSSFSTGTAPATPTGDGSTPSAIAIDPTGKFLLVADSQNAANDTNPTPPIGQLLVFAIDQTTGDLSPATGGFATVTDTGAGNSTNSVALTVNPVDTPYAFATNQFDPPGGLAGFSFNNPRNSGTLTQLIPWQTATGNNPVWVTVDPLDRFVYVSNSSNGSISGFSLNLSNGALTPLNGGAAFTTGFGAGATTGAIAIDPTGRFMYVTDTTNTKVVAFSIDATTGVLTPITGSPYATDAVADAPFAVSVDPSGHFVYVGNTGQGTIAMFTADPNTGALSTIGGSPLSYGTGNGANAIAIQ